MLGSIALAAMVGAAALAGCGSSPGPGPTVTAFLGALARRDYTAAAAQVDLGAPDLAATYTSAVADLGARAITYRAAPPVVTGSSATAALTTHLDVAAFGPIDLHSTIHLHRVGGHWRIEWSPSAVADQLAPGDHFSVVETWPARAPVLGAGGAALTPSGYAVGLVGQRITDPAQVMSIMVAAGFPAATVSGALRAAAAHPAQLVPVGTIPEVAYRALKASPAPNLYTVGGTTFTSGAQTTLTPDLAAHVVGTVAPITAEQLARLGFPYTSTSSVGQGGIESGYERSLAGTPAVSVAVHDTHGATVAALATRPPTPGRPVDTTLDPTVQSAAEAAMGGLSPSTQAAVVVLRASTGAILASVSRPTATPFDLALDAQVPPGSTFKVVSTAALLQSGDTAATTTTCPQSRTVDGQVFTNFEGEAAASLSLADAFAVSCNTAFIGLTGSLPHPALPSAASLFGLGTTPRPGLPVAGSSVPIPADANQLAGTTIGQAGVVVSPLAMASVAATVDAGAYHPPRLVVGAPDDSAPSSPLPPGVADGLRSLMAAVVVGHGTAAGAGLPAGTAGKTGTAEYGGGPHPPTHAWFIGFRGDLAFAVFVYGGGIGGAVAAPLAAAMLKALPAGY